ncbi:hypothetical protein O5D80_004645 [Batrachochytrium dendrobatidis]|nr:hypothetical protein O5D80_004645 [Batrachochytrium dendrobatidis]
MSNGNGANHASAAIAETKPIGYSESSDISTRTINSNSNSTSLPEQQANLNTTAKLVDRQGMSHRPSPSIASSTFSSEHNQVFSKQPSLSAPEGVYYFRDQIMAESCQSGSLCINPRYGTHVSIVTVKSTDTQVQPIPPPMDANPSSQTRFIEIPINGDGAGNFQFFKRVNSTIKKVKPPMTKATSQFVSKILANENLAKILSFRSNKTTYLFFNAGKSFFWADSMCRSQQNPLSIIQFKDSVVTCHDANLLTRETMDNVLGFASGDILWYSPISGKFARLNRSGQIHKHAVRSIKWMPGSDTHFMAGFEDGSVLTFDKDLDDQSFTAPTTTEDFMVSKSFKQLKHNPIEYWKVSKKAITAISFSPDCQHVAITSMEGVLAVIDFVNGRLLDVYKSFFGGFLCVSWSPDGKFILTGGQDDLVSVWAFRGRIVARCQGHTSWVSGVSFDQYRCTERNYRFGSIGDDTRLCLWDFAISSLHRPRSVYGSMSRVRSRSELDRRSTSDISAVHEALPKAQVPIIESFAQRKGMHDYPLCNILFLEDSIVTSDKTGLLRIWNRPTS